MGDRGDKPFRVIQVTDTHLLGSIDGKLLGVNTVESLAAVISLIQKEQTDIDFLLITGDLSQDGSLSSYERLYQMLEVFDVPMYWLPGNHDDISVMSQVTHGQSLMQRRVAYGNWQVLLLDSTVTGTAHGNLSDKELNFVKEVLAAYPEQHTLLSMHHHPILMGSNWIDNLGVRNADSLWAMINEVKLSGAGKVDALLWGHVHQSLDRSINGVKLMSTPSTCIQFAPESAKFQLDKAAPGYRWLDLYPDGRISTGVSRVSGIDFHADLSAEGY